VSCFEKSLIVFNNFTDFASFEVKVPAKESSAAVGKFCWLASVVEAVWLQAANTVIAAKDKINSFFHDCVFIFY